MRKIEFLVKPRCNKANGLSNNNNEVNRKFGILDQEMASLL